MAPCLAFYMGYGESSQVLMLVWSAFYQLSPSPSLVFRSFDRAWLCYFGPVPEPSHTLVSHCQMGMIKISLLSVRKVSQVGTQYMSRIQALFVSVLNIRSPSSFPMTQQGSSVQSVSRLGCQAKSLNSHKDKEGVLIYTPASPECSTAPQWERIRRKEMKVQGLVKY